MIASKRILSKRCFGTSAPVAPKRTQLFINNQFVNSSSGTTFETFNPHNEKLIAKVHEASNEDVDHAVSSARKAFEKGPWSKTSGQDRSRLLYKLAHLIDKNREELAALEALDNGKTAATANAVDLEQTVNTYKYFAGWADKIHGQTIPLHGDFFGYVRKEPVGVVAQIIPWNFPILMQTWKLAPALAAGCTVVMKTAELTPLSALRIGELIKEAGFPEGVVNILSGLGHTTGKYLASHPGIDKIAFTGSTPVGLEILANSSKNGLKRVSLELGGKSPNIILDDAVLDNAVIASHFGLFFNCGQSCNAGSRVLVHEKIYDEFVERSIKLAKEVVMGDQFDPKTTQGPLVSKKQQERVLNYIEAGKKEGATLLTGGKKYGDKGFHVEPTIFGDVKDHMKIAKEEIFGPVMSIFKFSTVDEAIEKANNTEFGLAAGVFGQDINQILHVTSALRAGQVYVNCFQAEQPSTPFGGFKNSGIGRELGRKGLDGYLEAKTVIMSRPSGSLP